MPPGQLFSWNFPNIVGIAAIYIQFQPAVLHSFFTLVADCCTEPQTRGAQPLHNRRGTHKNNWAVEVRHAQFSCLINAKKNYENALIINPNFISAHMNLSIIKSYVFDVPIIYVNGFNFKTEKVCKNSNFEASF